MVKYLNIGLKRQNVDVSPKTVFWSRILSKTLQKKIKIKKNVIQKIIFSYKNVIYLFLKAIVRYQCTLMFPIFFPFWTVFFAMNWKPVLYGLEGFFFLFSRCFCLYLLFTNSLCYQNFFCNRLTLGRVCYQQLYCF